MHKQVNKSSPKTPLLPQTLLFLYRALAYCLHLAACYQVLSCSDSHVEYHLSDLKVKDKINLEILTKHTSFPNFLFSPVFFFVLQMFKYIQSEIRTWFTVQMYAAGLTISATRYITQEIGPW
jgi:hypothetical protein